MSLVEVEKEVFSRLDPILRLLLASIEHLDVETKNYHTYNDYQKNHAATTACDTRLDKQKMEKEESSQQKILILLRTQVRLLQQLRQTMATTTTSDSITTTPRSQKQSKTTSASTNNLAISPLTDKLSKFLSYYKHTVNKEVWQHRQALLSMAEYIFLPLIIILQSTTQNQQQYQHYQDGPKETIEFQLVYQSSIFNSLEEAAQTLSFYVSIVHNYDNLWNDIGEDAPSFSERNDHYNGTIYEDGEDNDDNVNDNDVDNYDGDNNSHDHDHILGTTILSIDVRLKCVMACAMALASVSGMEDNHYQGTQNEDTQLTPPSKSQPPELNMSKSAIFAKPDTYERLNKGEDCNIFLLRCVQVLCSRPQPRSCHFLEEDEELELKVSKSSLLKIEAEFTHQMIQAMGGGNLIARLVQSCLSCFGSYSPPLTTNSTASKCDSNPSQACHNHHDIRGNVTLKIQALHTLQSIFSLHCSRSDTFKACGVTLIDNNNVGGMVGVTRSLLPGCFEGLFKQALNHLRFSTSMSSPKIAIESIKNLALLLNLALTSKKYSTENKSQDPPVLVTRDREKEQHQSSSDFSQVAFTQLAAAVSSLTTETTKVVTEEITPNIVLFANHVNGKLPPPLLVLLNLIPSHKSTKVRKAGAEFLCKCILVDTYLFWFKGDTVGASASGTKNCERQHQYVSQGNDLVDGALECLLTMLGGDEVNSISTTCKGILHMHRQRVGATMWRKEISYSIIPRTLSLIESLPALARSGREIELQTRMKLITGYLFISQNQDYLGGKETTYLASKMLEIPIRQALADIFALDISIIPSAVKVVHNLKDDTNMTSSFNISNTCNFCNMQGQSPLIAKRMVQAIAHILTAKQIAIFVDACIAQLFDNLCENTHSSRSLCDKQHAQWIHRYHGLIIVANELLKGESATMVRRLRVTSALARSIIPIIFSDPLWYLPTSLELAKTTNQERRDNDMLDVIFTKTRHCPVLLSNMVAQRNGTQPSHTLPKIPVCRTALNGNSLLTVYLMELVGTVSIILKSHVDGFLPTILYPLLQKTSDMNNDYVQQTAYVLLSRISTDLGFCSTRAMLSFNCNTLMETIASELLCPRQIKGSDLHHHHVATCFHSIEIIMQNLLNNMSALRQSDSLESDCHKRDINDETHIIMLIEMLDAMIFWFNNNSNKGHRELSSISVVSVSLIKAFTGSAKYLNELMMICERQSAEAINSNTHNCEYSEPWSDLLLQFKRKNHCSHSVSDGIDISGKDGFLAHHYNKEYPQARTKKEFSKKHETTKFQCAPSHNILKRVANITRHMLSLSSFFLSSANLEIQQISCDMLLNGFHLLSSVGYISKSMGDASDIGNPLLESVHQFWPPLRARLQTSGNGLIIASQRQAYDSSSPPFTGRHLSILFSKVLGVTSTLCELSGSSMVDCIQKDVWPVVAEVIYHFLQTAFTKDMENTKGEKQTGDAICKRINHPAMAGWEYQTLVSCLECIQRVFSCEIGLLLSQLVPTAGAIVMPLLSDNGMIGDAAMDAVKALVRIDSDSLWRSLLMVSSINLPDRPLLPFATKDIISYHGSETTVVSKDKIAQLLKYISNLPELSFS